MSTGEKVLVTCNSDQAFGNQGFALGEKLLVKPGETVAYEIEMVNAQYDPFNFKLIQKGIDDAYPQYHDFIKYKYEVWVGDDREYIIGNYNSGNYFVNGVSFDNSDSVCVTEALRKLTVGGIAEVNCPFRYTPGGQTFPKMGVPQDADLSFRIQLLSLRKMNWHLYSELK